MVSWVRLNHMGYICWAPTNPNGAPAVLLGVEKALFWGMFFFPSKIEVMAGVPGISEKD